ncbi:MAG TPA: hypothetical protein VH062_24375 [Polyangiaceae bacterium]|nr:hypothetical protein [Polyangiaceae bacterium]
MSHLDEYSESFFQKGYEGTYDGGPRSLRPAVVDSSHHDEDELATAVTPEVLERRGRAQRIVIRVVGVLGAAVLVLLPFRLGITGGTGSSSGASARLETAPSRGELPRLAAATPAADVAMVATPAVVANATAEQVVAPTNTALPSHAVASTSTAHSHAVASTSTAHAVAVAVASPNTTLPSRAHATASERVAATSHRPNPRTDPTRRMIPKTHGALHRASATHSPPTATFPD